MKYHIPLYGAIMALCAAALNASIGTFSKVLMLNGMSPSFIAFSKTVLGAIILCVIVPLLDTRAARIKWHQAAACAFLGIFVLFFFETMAYEFETAAGVVVVLMASASISAILLGRLLLGEVILAETVMGAFLAICGVAIIIGARLSFGFSPAGTALAICAGCGYGAFSVAMKRMKLEGGLALTRQLLIYGGLFLFIPALNEGNLNFTLTPLVISCIVALAVFPTILGFYCTTKAIQHLSPAKVQILELSEPVFAAIIAFIFLREIPGIFTYAGGALVIFGISVASGFIRLPLRGAR